MKIKKIIDLCKRSKRLFLYDGGAEQWISDGCAMYPLFDLPQMDELTICRAYDIDDKQREKISFKYETSLPEFFDFSDDVDGEPSERGALSLFDGGRRIVPYTTSQGVVFIDERYLEPFYDGDTSLLELYERNRADGSIYFAVKKGFTLVGLVLPVDVINDQFVERLEKLFTNCKIALFNQSNDG